MAFAPCLQGFYRGEKSVTPVRPGGLAGWFGRQVLLIFDRGEQNASFVGAIGLPIAAAFSNHWRRSAVSGSIMLKVKDTLRATVHLTFDGRVIKSYHGPDAKTRFENEVRILRHLEARGCNFVPKLLEAEATQPRIITSNCGARVQHLDELRTKELFAELEPYGVRHDDPDIRNVTYRQSDGRFCVIDFEFATLLSNAQPSPAA